MYTLDIFCYYSYQVSLILILHFFMSGIVSSIMFIPTKHVHVHTRAHTCTHTHTTLLNKAVHDFKLLLLHSY